MKNLTLTNDVEYLLFIRLGTVTSCGDTRWAFYPSFVYRSRIKSQTEKTSWTRSLEGQLLISSTR